MSEKLETLSVILKANISEFKKGFSEAFKESKAQSAAIKKELKSIKDPFDAFNGQSANKAMAKLKQMTMMMKGAMADMKVGTGLYSYTEEFRLMVDQIQQARQHLEALKVEASTFVAAGGDTGSEYYQNLKQDIDSTKEELSGLAAAMEEVEKTSGLVKFNGLGNAAKRAAAGVANLVGKLKDMAAAGIRKASGLFGALIQRMRSMHSASKAAGGGIGDLAKKIVLASVGIRGLFMLVRRMSGAMQEGFGDMVKAMPLGETARNINTLKNSLAQLKGALASAFAPILNTVAPALNTLIQMAVSAANAVGMLMAAITGKKFVAATSAANGAAGAVGNVGKEADKSNDSIKKLQRTVMGFDELHKLGSNDDNDNSSGNGSGSGGGAGSSGPGYSFEEMPISDQIKEFAEKIKEAWKNADFTEIGTIVGTKLRDALNSIPWDDIKTVCNKIAKSTATFLNGFFETPGLFTAIGNTLAEALNTAFGALNTFAENFHWSSFGKAISDSINAFFQTFDFKGAATTVSNVAKGILDAIIAAIENTNWKKIGERVQEFLVNIDWNGVFNKLAEAVGAAFGGIASFFAGLFKGVPEAIHSWWEKNALNDEGEFIIEGFFNGIKNAISAIGNWIKKNIFDPFINGFKKAFDISSPSKVMETQGGYLIDGLLNGLRNKVTDIVNWFKDLPKTIMSKVGSIAVNVVASLTSVNDAIAGAKKTISGFTAGLTKPSDLIEKAKKTISGFTAGLTGKKDSIDKDNKNLSGFKAGISSIADKIKSNKLISGIKGGITSLKNSLSKDEKSISGLTGKVTKLKDGLSKSEKTINVTAKVTKVQTKKGLHVKNGTTTKAEGGIYKNGSWHPVTAAASGGAFDTGQMFVAREAGPELVGMIGRSTAVLNNNQIVNSVAAGVSDAVADVLMSFLGTQMDNDQSGDLVIIIGDEEVARASLRGMKKLNKQFNPNVVFGGV